MEEQERLQLRSEGLVKIYGKRMVVNNVTFDVRQGEIVGLLGPNGAGKTTSFYMTTGLVLPNDGHIFLGDEEITDLPVYKRARLGIGYLAQEASVFRKMSVEDNISCVLEMTDKPKEEQREKIIAEKIHRLEAIRIKDKFDYDQLNSLTIEARQKLKKINPVTLAQASRIPGISPSDINVLLVLLGR